MKETEPGDATDPISNQRPVYPFEIPVTALLKLSGVVVATVVVLMALTRAQQLVGLVIAAGILATLINPFVTVFTKVVGRVAATIVVHVVVLIAFVVSVGFVVQAVQRESAALEAYTVAQVEEIGPDDGATFVSSARLDERLGDALESWGVSAVVGDNASSGATGTAAVVSELVIIIVFSIFFTLQSATLISLLVTWTPDRARRRVLRDALISTASSAATYSRRALGVAVVSGSLLGAVAVVFDVPGALLIGVFAAFLSLVPVLGVFVGCLPLLLVAAAEHSPGAVAVIAVVSLVVAVSITWARVRFVTSGVAVGSFAVAIGIAAGLTAGGPPGAVCGMFLAVLLTALVARRSISSADPAVEPIALPPREASYVQMTWAVENRRSTGPTTVDQRLLVQPTNATLLRVAAIVIAAFVIQLSLSRIGPIIVSTVVGILIAIGLDRPVSWVENRFHARRTTIVVAGALLLATAVGGLTYVSATAFDGAGAIDTDVGGIVESFENTPLIGDRLAELDLQRRIEQFSDDAPQMISDSSITDQALSALSGGLVGAFWILVATVTCLLDGPRIVAVVTRRTPARFRRQTQRLGRAAHRALSGYVAGSALVAGLNGVIIGTIGFAVGVPAPALLALWAFSWNFVPQIGAIVGWAPLLALTFLSGPITGILVLVLFVVYQLLENNLIQPAIVGQAVDISALAALSAALFGVTVAGLIGAVLAIPVAGVARALAREWRRDDFPSVRIQNTSTSPRPPSLP